MSRKRTCEAAACPLLGRDEIAQVQVEPDEVIRLLQIRVITGSAAVPAATGLDHRLCERCREARQRDHKW